MHFAIAVVLPPDFGHDAPEESVRAAVEAAMSPYDENLQVEPYPAAVYDIEAMRQAFARDQGRVPDDEELRQWVGEWEGVVAGKDAYWEDGKLYGWHESNGQGHWDWWELGGRWAGLVDVLDEMDSPDDIERVRQAVGDSAKLNVGRLGDHAAGKLAAVFYGLLGPEGSWADQYTLTGGFGQKAGQEAVAAEFAKLVADFPDRCFAVVDYHS